ncbi:hypothetical protein Q4Q39_06970 [Flavivirga amylovorans]|uniref:Uncharacterized protein n=1 Tax=Flavivirga amylovorans TaxID=870486 RepID=A0ABT8WZN5_9FLAO|nr:hypothetical protein [Flavivirga amylovorans]MDO5987133.1 hypothetical protein [Flavivirga amylovorans]
MTTLIIKDETASGNILNEIRIKVENERTTLKDIITARVLTEVQVYNSSKPEYFKGLIQPSDTEKTLNGFRVKKRKSIDGEQQVYVALDAFMRNGFFVIVDDEQITDYDQEILVSSETKISFLKLTPLVGG